MITLILIGFVFLVIFAAIIWSFKKGRQITKYEITAETQDRYRRGVEGSQRSSTSKESPEDILRKNDGKWE